MSPHSFFSATHEAHRTLTDLVMVTKIEMDPDKITHLMARLDVTLRRHFEIEDKELYPPLMEVVDDWEDRAVLIGAHEDHQVIMRLLEDLENTPPTDERFRGKVHTLDRLWEHHSEEEEGALYDLARSYLSEEDFRELKERIQKEEKAEQKRAGEERERADASGQETETSAREGRQRRA